MNKFVSFFIISVFFSGYFASNLHKVFALVPEALSFIVLLIIAVRLAISKSMAITPKYVVLGFLVGLHVLAGLILNSVSPGTIVTGIRPYLKWLPIFILPMVYSFSERDIGKQLKLILGLSLIQVPVAVYQRFVQYKGAPTGDVVTGTLGDGASGALSILMLSAIAILIPHYLSGRIRFKTFSFLLCLLFIPTMINETKVTLILAPIAFVVPYIYASRNRLSISKLMGISTLSVVLIVGFVYIYDHIRGQWDSGTSIIDYYSSDRGASYLFNNSEIDIDSLLTPGRIGSSIELPSEMIGRKEAGGRLDKLLLPFKTLSSQPISLWFGLGIGNVSVSVISMYSGQYAASLGQISGSSLFVFLAWETGIGGVILFLLFLGFLVSDAHRLSRSGVEGALLSSGWVAVIVIIVITFSYINILFFNALIFVFSYFSGYVVAQWATRKYSISGVYR